MDLILAFSLQDQVEKYGAYVGLAAFLGLAVLSLLYFAQARELKRLRDWAGRAPERAQELEARVVAQAEEALREPEPAVPAAEPAAASGNGRQAAAIPMGPRPAVAVAAAAARAQAAQVTVDAPAVAASTDGDVPDDRAAVAAAEGGAVATPAEDRAAVPVADAGAVAPVEEDAAVQAGDGGPVAPVEEDAAMQAGDGGQMAPPGDDEAVVAVGDGGPMAPPGEDRDESAAEPPAEAEGDDRAAADERAPEPSEEDRAAAAPGDERAARPPDEDRAPEPEPEPARSGNGVPAAPPTQIPRATPRPQARPAAPLRAATPSRAAPPPRRTPPRTTEREGRSRAGLYMLLGVLVLVAAVAVPVYLMAMNDDEPAPPPNPIAEPGGTPSAAAGGAQAPEDRPEKVVVVLNGTPIDGLASRERDKLLAAGYSDEQGMIRTDNNQDQACQDSIVYFTAEERRQARDVSRLLDITRTEQIDGETQALADSSDESGTLPADVVALLCADKSP
jgi:LytR cell envelope-related transcriptional attenuator